MKKSDIDNRWPNALRWFLTQNLRSFTPWHLIDDLSECEGAANAFRREDIDKRDVFVFAKRQDCDDFAGLEIVQGAVTDRVIYFHPSFTASPNEQRDRGWNIVDGVFEDVFEFVAKQIVPDMKAWALTEDASDLGQ
jgi:hypothetical protein